MKRTALFMGCATVLMVGATAAAQQPRRSPGDTLVFQEVARTNGEMQGMQVSGEMRYHLYVAYLGGDSAEVWYDSLSFNTSMPTPQPPDLAGLARKKVIAHFHPNGRVSGLEPPGSGRGAGMSMTPSFATVSIALPLPAQPLRRGLTWTDTTSTKIDTLGVIMTISNNTQYEVVGDSSVDNLPVLVVATRGAIQAEGSGGAVNMQTSSEGEATGRLYYSPALGVVVKRTSQAQIKTNMSAVGMSMQMSNRAEQEMALIKAPARR